jgi:hypothetical protein
VVTSTSKINVTFEETTAKFLSYLANFEHKTVLNLVSALTLEALETREDLSLSKIAEKLDKESVKTYTHDEVWK